MRTILHNMVAGYETYHHMISLKLSLIYMVVVNLFQKLPEVAQHIYSFGLTRCMVIVMVFI